MQPIVQVSSNPNTPGYIYLFVWTFFVCTSENKRKRGWGCRGWLILKREWDCHLEAQLGRPRGWPWLATCSQQSEIMKKFYSFRPDMSLFWMESNDSAVPMIRRPLIIHSLKLPLSGAILFQTIFCSRESEEDFEQERERERTKWIYLWKLFTNFSDNFVGWIP